MVATEVACQFPSAAWFEALRTLMKGEEGTFRKLGFIDATAAITVEGATHERDRHFVLAFGAYTCDQVEEVSSREDCGADFSLSAPAAVWKEMVENIRANDGADLRHTLNYLHFGQIELKAADQLRADLFFRVNGSLQAFFDLARFVATSF